MPRYCKTTATDAGKLWRMPYFTEANMPMPRRMLASGPAMAIRNSVFALVGSSPISATPPKIKRVIPWIGTPDCRATSECASSWITIELKNPNAPAAAMSQ